MALLVGSWQHYTNPSYPASPPSLPQVKLWDISDNKPAMVCAQDLKAGAVFTASFCADAPHLLAAGGAGGEVVVWDVRAHDAVAAKYPDFAATLPGGRGQGAAGGDMEEEDEAPAKKGGKKKGKK